MYSVGGSGERVIDMCSVGKAGERVIDMNSVGTAREQVIDMNTHPDGHFCSLPFVVLNILWRQFYRVDCTAYINSFTYF